MKKFSITVKTKSGEKKVVYVNVDDKTAAILQETNNEQLIREYLLGEYKYQMIERKETRRHISLDYLHERGIDFEVDPISDFEKYEDIMQSINKLTPSRKTIVKLYFFDCLTQSEIADLLNISISAVSQRIAVIKKQLRKFIM